MPHRLVHLDELERNGLAGLVVLDGNIAVRILMRGDVVVDGAGWIEFAAGERGSRKGAIEIETVLKELVESSTSVAA
jgi:N-dimethylarginine dimethylaminohydrolase